MSNIIHAYIDISKVQNRQFCDFLCLMPFQNDTVWSIARFSTEAKLPRESHENTR